jgi:hypothetical protein
VGSITGTFFAGFILLYLLPVSTIVNLVAAALALLAALMLDSRGGRIVALAVAALLGLGSVPALAELLPKSPAGMPNPLAALGQVGSIALAVVGLSRLNAARRDAAPADELGQDEFPESATGEFAPKSGLTDLAVLSFLASLTFMGLEMVAGRMVTRHLGSSIYGWTSVIGVLLGGLSVGNYLGGKIADYIRRESQASTLFLVASVLTVLVLFFETPPEFVGKKLMGSSKPVLSQAISLTKVSLPGGTEIPLQWPARVLLVVAVTFFLPSLAMGTVSPVVAKLAVDRLRRSKRTGTAIGQVYAWGMVGSILGTFLTGFVLIDHLGTKGVLLIMATLLAFASTGLGTVWHAIWAGIPLGLCVIAFAPVSYFVDQGIKLGVREEKFNPDTDEDALAWIDESDYYYIKVTNEPDSAGKKRTLVLDNLIHGYFILGHPERLDYDYEHIYAQVAYRVAAARAKAAGQSNPSQAPLKTLFLGGGAYTFQRYMQFKYPGTAVDVAEIDPAVTRANFAALGLPRDTPIKTTWGDARQFVEKNQNVKSYDIVFGDAFNDFSVPWHLTTQEFNEKLAKMLGDDGVYMINIIDAYQSEAKTNKVIAQRIDEDNVGSEAAKAAIASQERRKAKRFGGFLGAWTKTAKKTFSHVYIFGTDMTPGSGTRETFVVVASKKPLDLDNLGGRGGDPQFLDDDRPFEPRPFDEGHTKAVEERARGIILTDDYAPVENLLAPVAETRGDDD